MRANSLFGGRSRRRREPAGGEIRHAAPLSRDLVLVVAATTDDADPGSAALRLGDDVAPDDQRCLTSVSVASPGRSPARLFTVRVGTGGDLPVELADVFTDVRTLLRHTVTPLDPANRQAVVRFLVTAAGAHGIVASRELSEQLFCAREALRERLPASVIDGRDRLAVNVERLMAIDERSFYVDGWLHDADGAVTRLTAVSPEGSRAELLPGLYRYDRPDVASAFGAASAADGSSGGFVSYFHLDEPSLLDRGWRLEAGSNGDVGAECEAPEVIRDADTVRAYVLAGLANERLPDTALKVDHVRPAIEILQRRHRDRVEIRNVVDYGPVPRSPEVSIVVPLYGRIDFLRHQLAHFVHDPELQDAELLYVLDSPEMSDALADLAVEVFALYRLPFRVVTLNRNGGFALANNLGAGVASGRRLLLLNSDVIPAAPGWLGRLCSFYDSTPRIGALGPKLLFEDDALQHAGMYFHRRRGVWYNHHFFKGLHRVFPDANVARAVPAVTAACLLVDRTLYERVGGLSGAYVQGDYEDSDFCLRLLDAGRENWYLPEVELYHLEGQSYPDPLRRMNAEYNCWLHTHLWHEQIETAMARFATPVSV